MSNQPRIATLTLNPAIDVAYAVEKVFHTRKMRTHGEHYTPGGGGINVARVFRRFGGEAQCFYLAGGATGSALDGLLDRQGIERHRIEIDGHTRVCMTVYEDESGKEYRFVPPGPTIGDAEWRACLDAVSRAEGDYLVASGSLPPGVPEEFYGEVGKIAAARGMRFVLDSSGAGLRGGLAAGGIYLMKPSIGELRQYCDLPLETAEEAGRAAMGIIAAGKARIVAVTLGHEGALLATPEGPKFLPAIKVEANSAVGAGDSFVAAMVHGLASGSSPSESFRLGIAAGAAAVLAPGGDLCQPAEVTRLLPLVGSP